MKTTISLSPPAELETESLVALALNQADPDQLEKNKEAKPQIKLATGDSAVQSVTADLFSSGEVTGKQFEINLLHKPAGLKAKRLLVISGGAVAQASRELAERAKHIGAWLMQADPSTVRIEGGAIVGGQASISLTEVAQAWYLQPQHLPPDVNPGGLEVTAGYRPGRDSGTFSYAAHAATIALDPGTAPTRLAV